MLETPHRFEPAFLEGALPGELVDLALDLKTASQRLPGRLPPATVRELAGLVRIMNSYYSNLIEGNNTRPAEIEAALARNAEGEERPLVIEGMAHVKLQARIDEIGAEGKLAVPTDTEVLLHLHRRFYEAMPEAHRVSRLGEREVKIVPGTFRSRADEDVVVGRHHPPSSERVVDFMNAFSRRFAQVRGSAGLILAIPAAHHRLNYIHPFVDGNGRVSRLMSHAMGHRAGIAGGGLWSISRGLARGLRGRDEYKMMMDATDQRARGSRDGRGNLSEAALVEFTKWFMEVSIDQVSFFAGSFDLDRLGERYRSHLRVRYGDERPGRLVSRVLELGEMDRGAAVAVVGGGERTARTILARCVQHGFLKSDTPKGRVRVAFPQPDLPWLFPGLFADGPVPDRPPLRIGDGLDPTNRTPPRTRPARSGRRKDGWER